MIPVTDLVARGLPASFVNMLPQFCESCDSALELSETLQELRCSNVFCPEIVACRLHKFLQSLGCDVLTSTLEAVCLDLGLRSVYDIFEDGFEVRLNEYAAGSGLDVDVELRQVLCGVIKRVRAVPLWYLVRMGYFEDVSEYAYAILSDVSDLTAFYDDFVDTGFLEFQAFILSRLGSSSGFDVDVLCAKLFVQFTTYRDELFRGLDLVDVQVISEQKGILPVLLKDASSLGRLLLAYNEKLGSRLFLYCVDWVFGRKPDALWYPHDLGVYSPAVLQDVRDNFDGVPVVNRGSLLPVLLGKADSIVC